MSAINKYETNLKLYPKRGSGLHQHIMSTACLGVIAEIPPPSIIRDMESAFEGIKPKEASDAVSKASGMTYDSEYVSPAKVVPMRPRLTLDRFIGDTPQEGRALMESSPIPLLKNNGRLLLETLYAPDEYLFLGDTRSTTVKTVREWLDDYDYPHIAPNPMTGEIGLTQAGKESRRCDASVADARFAVCEMDNVPIGMQVAFWLECIRIKIPVSAVIYSGKKSLHGWVRVDCGADTDKWNSMVKGWLFADFGKRYGLDTSCANRGRLSRMPDHRREEGKQVLMYLNEGAK